LDTTKANIAALKPSPILLDNAVGEKPQSAFLNVWGNDETSIAGSSLLSHIQGAPDRTIETEILTLDMISQDTGFVPDLVKLDLQGAELPALKGAESILETAELFIIEFGCLEAYEDRTTPRELIDIMYDNNYCLYDIVDLIYRPYDGAMASGDFFFIKNDSPLRSYKGYL
jgi:FkbM family methyltransferase